MLVLASVASAVLGSASARASVIDEDASPEPSALMAARGVYAEGSAGIGKYVWFVDRLSGEDVLRGFDQSDPFGAPELATIDGTAAVGPGPLGHVTGVAFAPLQSLLFVADSTNDRLIAYPRSNEGEAGDPVNYAGAIATNDFVLPHFGFTSPRGVAIDPRPGGSGYLSVLRGGSGERGLVEFDPTPQDGQFEWFNYEFNSSVWKHETGPAALAVDPDTGHLYVVMEGKENILEFSPHFADQLDTLSSDTDGDYVGLTADAASNRLIAAKADSIDVFSLATGRLLGTVTGIDFGEATTGLAMLQGSANIFLSSAAEPYLRAYVARSAPTCTEAAPISISPGESTTFVPDCDDPDHSEVKEFSIVGTPAHGVAGTTPDDDAITYTAATGVTGDDEIAFRVTTQDGRSAVQYQAIEAHDTIAPVVEITSPADGSSTTNPEATLTFTAEDETDPEPDCDATSGSPITLSDGVNTITVSCTDDSGNTGSDTVTVRLDKTPPEVTIIAPSDTTLVTDPQVTITYTASDESGTDPVCNYADGEQIPLVPGLNQITLTCTDAAGNTTSSIVELTYDAAGPAIAITSLADGDSVSDSFVKLDYTVVDDVDPDPICSPPAGSQVSLSPGENTIVVTCTDQAGHVSTRTVRITYAPVVQAKSEPPPVIRQTTNLEPVSGNVFVKFPGSDEYIPLKDALQIPMGTVVDARDGKGNLTFANKDGSLYDSDFWGGVFDVHQGKGDRPFAIMKLRDDLVKKADAALSRRALIAGEAGPLARDARRRGKRRNGLWGNGKGNFKTSGSGGAASVRGTNWYVANYTGGTLFSVRRGIVNVRPIHGNCFDLRAGESRFIYYKASTTVKKQKGKNKKKGCWVPSD